MILLRWIAYAIAIVTLGTLVVAAAVLSAAFGRRA